MRSWSGTASFTLCRYYAVLLAVACGAFAQEAGSGIDLRATVTAQATYADALGATPRDGSPLSAGLRSMLYPTIKLSDRWIVSGIFQAVTRPYGRSDFSSIGGGVRGQIIRLDLSWTRTWSNGSVVVRAGQLTSAFGSFLLRYDDAENPLTGMPSAYGYYKPVTPLGLAGAEADFTTGKWDGRVQFTNSSPANPRSLFSQDQYANWAGGAGYTIRQGLRIGMSAYRGPYLDRHHPYYFPGEARPRDLPATGLGVDGEWARGHWNARGELQRFVLAYRLLPTFRETAGYAEVRRVLNPRWFVAARADYLHNKYGVNAFELAAGYRPNRSQLIKAGYTVSGAEGNWRLDRVFTFQLVSTIQMPSLALR